jgi:hypothetical protein
MTLPEQSEAPSCENCYHRRDAECHRNAPIASPNYTYVACWPTIRATDWCGEWYPITEDF